MNAYLRPATLDREREREREINARTEREEREKKETRDRGRIERKRETTKTKPHLGERRVEVARADALAHRLLGARQLDEPRHVRDRADDAEQEEHQEPRPAAIITHIFCNAA